VKRIIYPIGHGGFFVEIFTNEAFIYDCGSFNKNKVTTEVNTFIKCISKLNLKYITIFISHFDYDHVNAIPYLVGEIIALKIKINVVLPYRSAESTFIDYLIGYRYNENNIKAVTHFEEYLNTQMCQTNTTGFIKIIYCNYEYGTESNEDSYTSEQLYELREKPNKKYHIESGTTICIDKWKYVLYNFPYDNNIIYKLQQLLAQENILEEFIKFVKNQPNIFNHEFNKKWYKSIKKIYSCLDLEHNNTSMVVFSFVEGRNIGAVLTGDYNLMNKPFQEKFFIIFNKYKSYIALFQLPHHGSNKNINNSIIMNILCDNVCNNRKRSVLCKLLQAYNSRCQNITFFVNHSETRYAKTKLKPCLDISIIYITQESKIYCQQI
jgi:hypothetical protein